MDAIALTQPSPNRAHSMDEAHWLHKTDLPLCTDQPLCLLSSVCMGRNALSNADRLGGLRSFFFQVTIKPTGEDKSQVSCPICLTLALSLSWAQIGQFK